MIQFLCLILRLAGDVYAELFQNRHIDLGKDDRGVHVAVLQFSDLLESALSVGIGQRADGERDQYLVRVESRIVVSEIVHFQFLYGFDDIGGYKMNVVIYPAERFQRVQKKRAGGAEKFCRLSGDDSAVGEFERRGGFSRRFRF